VVDTLQIKLALPFFYTIFLFSCTEVLIVHESDLINGMTVQKFVRENQYVSLRSIILIVN